MRKRQSRKSGLGLDLGGAVASPNVKEGTESRIDLPGGGDPQKRAKRRSTKYWRKPAEEGGGRYRC